MELSLKESRELPTPGVYSAKVLRIIDMGTPAEINSKFAPSRKLRFVFEIDSQMSDGRPFVVDKTYTASLATKSNLFKDLSAFAKHILSASELTGDPIKIQSLLGLTCMVQIDIKQSTAGSDYVKVVGVMAAPKGVSLPDSGNVSFFLSLTPGEFDRARFDTLPEWQRTAISETPEFKKL